MADAMLFLCPEKLQCRNKIANYKVNKIYAQHPIDKPIAARKQLYGPVKEIKPKLQPERKNNHCQKKRHQIIPHCHQHIPMQQRNDTSC